MGKNFFKQLVVCFGACILLESFSTIAIAQEQVLKIGLTAGFSGALSSMARPIRNAVLMLAEEVNQSGGIEVGGKRYKIEMAQCDTFTDPATGVACAHRFADMGLKFIVGPLASAVTLASKPITEERKILIVTSSMDLKVLEPPNKLTIRNNFTSEQAGILLTPYVKEKLRVKKVAVLTRNESWGLGNSEMFIKEFKKQGLEVVNNEIFEVGAKDFFTPLTKIKAKNPDAILLSTYPEEGGLILRQMVEIGMTIPSFCQGTPSGGKAFFEIGKENVRRHVSLLTSDPNCEKPKAGAYLKHYKEKYGEEPVSVQAGIWYDSLSSLLEAFKIAKSVDDVWKVRDAFNRVDFQGVAWRVRFWPNGQLIPQNSICKFDEKGHKEVISILGMERDGKIYIEDVRK